MDSPSDPAAEPLRDGPPDGSSEHGREVDPDHDPMRFHHWMHSSAAGGLLTGVALGLQHALKEQREQPAFVIEAAGDPYDPDRRIRLHFDPDDPTKSVAVVRQPPDTTE